MSVGSETGQSRAGVTPAGVGATPAPVAFNFSQTDTFAPLLKRLGVSLLVTTYQANKILVLREQRGGLSILVRSFDRPMGLAADARRISLGTRDQVWQLRNAPDIAPRVEPPGTHDACFIPRSSQVTGDIGVHEVAWGGEKPDELWLVSTRFSCLCTLHPDYSFVPRWRPPFITALAAEDRCHLNGLAMRDGRPRYVNLRPGDRERRHDRARPARGGRQEVRVAFDTAGGPFGLEQAGHVGSTAEARARCRTKSALPRSALFSRQPCLRIARPRDYINSGTPLTRPGVR